MRSPARTSRAIPPSAPSSEPRRTAGPAAAATRQRTLRAGERVAHLPRLGPAAVVADRRHVAPDEVAGQRGRVEVAAHGDQRPRPVDERVEPHPLQPAEAAAPVERPQRRPREVDADRARPPQDVGARAGPALGEPLEQPRPLGRRHLLLRRLGGHRHREQERRLVDRQQVELVAAAGQDVEPRGGVDRPGVKRRRQPLAVAVERVHERHVEPVLRRGGDRRAVGALEQHLGLEHVAERGDEPGRAEPLAGRLAELGLEADGPAQGGELARDEPLVHDVRDVDEAHVAAEDEQRQLVAAAGLDQRRRRRVGGLEPDARRRPPGPARRPAPRPPAAGIPARPMPGRQEELAAPDHARHERRLEDVHPLDPVPQPVSAGGHRDLGAQELLQAQEVADRQDRVSGFRRIHGHSVRWRRGRPAA